MRPLKPHAREYLKAAAEIAERVLKEAEKIIKPGIKIIEICEKLEQLIRRLGGRPAFPVNISINDIAAHYSSPPQDPKRIPHGSLVKVDIGVHVNGYIVDIAKTLNLGSGLTDLIKATEDALEAAIDHIKAGVRVSEIGAVIEREIKRYGYNPIKNLAGHAMERYNLHAGLSIPNVSSPRPLGILAPKLHEGMIVAIEPFATTGKRAYVVDDRPISIFKLTEKKPKTRDESRIYSLICRRCQMLPFSLRWFDEITGSGKAVKTFTKMISEGIIYAYPPLREVDKNPVAQAETTVIVHKNGAERLV
ncbi:MAG: type II methionyl aminopeptidase [Candidatus Baldrarchaeia archaeon]